jgi:hypothetical protein
MENGSPDGGLRFVQVGDVAPREFLAQMHGERRAVVHGQVLEWNADRFVAYTRYDPGFIIARHAHKSDALIFILEGEVRIGERNCPPGTLVVLEKDTFFGPLVAGPQGCTFLESYAGDVASVHEDEVSYQQMLAARGVVPVAPVRNGLKPAES